jgi:hypothetical protein
VPELRQAPVQGATQPWQYRDHRNHLHTLPEARQHRSSGKASSMTSDVHRQVYIAEILEHFTKEQVDHRGLIDRWLRYVATDREVMMIHLRHLTPESDPMWKNIERNSWSAQRQLEKYIKQNC